MMNAARFAVVLLLVVSTFKSAHAQRNLGDPFVFENASGETMPYRLFTPPAAAASDMALPLVIFLHGAGEVGTDNLAQVQYHINGLVSATQSDRFASYLLAPQTTDGWSADGHRDLTMQILDSLTRSLSIDTDRIYITGLSMGGYGSFEYLRKYPDTFAAAVPMSGGGTPAAAATFSDVPIWMFHGDRDSTVPPQESRQMYHAIETAGGTPLLTEIANANHVIWEPIYRDTDYDAYGVYDWLYSQSRTVRPVHELLVADHDNWSYLSDGSEPADTWYSAEHDDSLWSTGVAPFGFGHDAEATTLNCGANPLDCTERYAKYYFRREFTVEDPSLITSVLAQIQRDDGVIVYLNGEEVFREANSRGSSFASASSLDDGYTAFRIDPTHLRHDNVLAVELRQARSKADTDLLFDLKLVAQTVPEPTGWTLGCLGAALLFWRRSGAFAATAR